MTNKVFPSHPHERKRSTEFFKAVKENDYIGVLFMLKDCKYYLYDFDVTKLTPLHWAV